MKRYHFTDISDATMVQSCLKSHLINLYSSYQEQRTKADVVSGPFKPRVNDDVDGKVMTEPQARRKTICRNRS